jgi:glutaredoxin
MRSLVRSRFLLLAGVLAGSVFAVDTPTKTTLYKSTNADGRTVYSDRPPGAGPPAKTMEFANLPGSPLSASTLAYLEELRKIGMKPASAAPSREVVLFTESWCPFCKKARDYLVGKGVAFREIDLKSNGGVAAFVQAGGRQGVPLLSTNGQRVQGFSPAAYDALLGSNHQ